MKPLRVHFGEENLDWRGGHDRARIDRTAAKSVSVLHVITCLQTGGANMALCKVLEHRDAEDGCHHVLSLMPGGALRDRVIAAGAEIEEIGLRRGQVSLPAALRLAAAVRRRRPDVLQGWTYHGNLAATVANLGSRRRVPVVWGVRHSILDLSNDKPMTRRLIRVGAPLSRTTAAVVYCSRASARQHERIGYDPSKTVVIPNGFECGLFRPRPDAGSELRKQLDIPLNRVIIGHVARFDPMKDHGNLIAAIARLIAEDQDVHLVMIGTAVEPDNPELAATIRGAGIGPRVSLLGERTDIPSLTPGFDLLALSSTSGEAFPNVLGEAMACGVPCVATDVGDCAWIVGDTGFVVPARDPAALAAGLRQMIDLGLAARQRLGEAARARVLDSFEIKEITRRYTTLYRSLTLKRVGDSPDAQPASTPSHSRRCQ